VDTNLLERNETARHNAFEHSQETLDLFFAVDDLNDHR
jgi:hypothetical protein